MEKQSDAIVWLALPFFSKLPPFQSALYAGEAAEKVLRFQCVREDKEVLVDLVSVIGSTESLVWKSCREMIASALKLAAQEMKGFFGYDLLTADLSRGLAHFNPYDFSRLLINHAAKMSAGDARLIQYGSFWGLLTKRIPEDWGKIDFKTYVEVYSRPPEQLGSWLCGLARKIKAADTQTIVIHSIGTTCLLQPDNDEQSVDLERFRGTFKAKYGYVPLLHWLPELE